MRKRFHIDRQVSKLADSLTPEVILGVLKKLSDPRVISRISDAALRAKHYAIYENSAYGEPDHSSCTMDKTKWKEPSTWYCNCTYCAVHMAYTYVRLEINKAERKGRRNVADNLYHDMMLLKGIKQQLENLPMFKILKDHIKEAKTHIGKSITSLRYTAAQTYHQKDPVLRNARSIIDDACKHGQKISWF